MQMYNTFIYEVIILTAWQLFFWKKYVKKLLCHEKNRYLNFVYKTISYNIHLFRWVNSF